MTDPPELTDARLRSHLAVRASGANARTGPRTTPAPPLAELARSVTAEPQRPSVALFPSGRVVGAGLAVAAVVAVAILGGLTRGPAPAVAPGSTGAASTVDASPGSAAVETNVVATTPSAAPATRAWTQLSWTRGSPDVFPSDGNAFVMDTIENGAGFVAVGYTLAADGTESGRVWISDDGRTWRTLSPPGFTGLVAQRIFRVGDHLVVLAERRIPGSPAVVEVLASRDGIDWASVPAPPHEVGSFAGKAVGGPLGIFMPGQIRDWFLGPDLAEWTLVRHTSATPHPARGGLFAAGPDRWFWLGATGSTKAGEPPTVGAIWSSTNGRTWEPAVIDRPGGAVSEIHAVDGGYVAIGIDHGLPCDGCLGKLDLSRVAWSSPDGSTWTRLDVAGQQSGDPLFAAMIGGDGHRLLAFADRFVSVVGGQPGGGIVTETTDGRTWSPIAVDGAGPRDLVPFTIGQAGIVAFDHVDRDTGRQLEVEPWWASAVTAP